MRRIVVDAAHSASSAGNNFTLVVPKVRRVPEANVPAFMPNTWNENRVAGKPPGSRSQSFETIAWDSEAAGMPTLRTYLIAQVMMMNCLYDVVPNHHASDDEHGCTAW